MANVINSASLVNINANEFASKFNSKKEVSFLTQLTPDFIFTGVSLRHFGMQGVLSTVLYGHHISLQGRRGQQEAPHQVR